MSGLQIENLSASYGSVNALHNVTISIEEGELVAVLGGNGAGKSTLLGCISGIVKTCSGSLYWNGASLSNLPPHSRVGLGIAHVPEGRKIFSRLSVSENLDLGAYLRTAKLRISSDKERVLSLFPILKDRLNQAGGTLSGGEQQMLALGRALMSSPRIMLLDEPSMGIAPIVTRTIFNVLKKLNQEEKLTILLVEQNAHLALGIASRAYVLENGRIVLHDHASEVARNSRIREAYLGETTNQ